MHWTDIDERVLQNSECTVDLLLFWLDASQAFFLQCGYFHHYKLMMWVERQGKRECGTGNLPAQRDFQSHFLIWMSACYQTYLLLVSRGFLFCFFRSLLYISSHTNVPLHMSTNSNLTGIFVLEHKICWLNVKHVDILG